MPIKNRSLFHSTSLHVWYTHVSFIEESAILQFVSVRPKPLGRPGGLRAFRVGRLRQPTGRLGSGIGPPTPGPGCLREALARWMHRRRPRAHSLAAQRPRPALPVPVTVTPGRRPRSGWHGERASSESRHPWPGRPAAGWRSRPPARRPH